MHPEDGDIRVRKIDSFNLNNILSVINKYRKND